MSDPKRIVKRHLVVCGKRGDMSASVGYNDSDYAIAWFWAIDGQDSLRNAREYVRLKRLATSQRKPKPLNKKSTSTSHV